MKRYRATIPPGAPVAVIAGQWTKREDGTIDAWYTREQLQMCVELTAPQTQHLTFKEWRRENQKQIA